MTVLCQYPFTPLPWYRFVTCQPTKKHSSVNKQSKFQQVFQSLYKHKQKSVTSGNSFISSNLRQNESNKFLTVPQSFCCFYQQFCGVDICQIAIRYYTTFTRCDEERTCINMEIISGLILHPCRLVRNFCLVYQYSRTPESFCHLIKVIDVNTGNTTMHKLQRRSTFQTHSYCAVTLL